MSTVLSYRNKDFSILITDTRVINFDPINNDYNYNDPDMDNYNKMFYIPNIGFIAGIGSGKLVENFCLEIKDYDNDYQQGLRICNAFPKVFNEFVQGESNDKIISYANKTGIYISDKREIRIYSKDCGEPYYCKTVKDNYLFIGYPDDFASSIDCDINSDNAIEVLNIMLNKFKVISQNSKYVSNISCVGILRINETEPIFYKRDADDILSMLSHNAVVPNQFNEYFDNY